jgi:phosphoglycerate dehydrogenase-like enzyme
MKRTASRPKIVVTAPMAFYPDQIERLKSLGDVTFHNDLAKSSEEWVKRCESADIICSGKYGLKEKIYEIRNAFFSVPFVAVGWIDKKKLKKSGITVSYSPGCNRHAVSEWIIAMMLILLRRLDKFINVKELKEKYNSQKYLGLAGKKVCILGKGNIGSRVGVVCTAFDIKIRYFKRGNDLLKCVKDADVVVNTLSTNPSTIGLLDKKFFSSLKRGSYFITVTGLGIYNSKAMLSALDKGILAGVADDAAGILPGDVDDPYYQKLLKHPKVLTTPHISFQSDVTARVSNDMMIDNVEAWIKGKPINVVS